MLFYTQPNLPWEPFDFKLLEAFQILEDETCPKCGQPTWLCRSTDEKVSFSVKETVCYATRAMEERRSRRDNTGKNKHKVTSDERKSWGRIEYAVPVVPSHVEGTLPTRSDFYRQFSGADVLVE